MNRYEQQVTYYEAEGHSPRPEARDEMRLIDLWLVLRRQRWVILAATVIGVGVALFVALTATPVYRAEVLLATTSSGGPNATGALATQFGGAAQLAGIDLPMQQGVSPTDKAIAILQSRDFTERFLKEEGLMPVILGDEAASNQGGSRAPPAGTEDGTVMWDASMWNAFLAFSSIRQVTVDKETGLVTLAVEWIDPAQAAEWANKLVQRLNEETRVRAVEEAEKNVEYLQERFENTTSNEMRLLMSNLLENETKKAMLAQSTDEFSFAILDKAVVPHYKVRPRRALIVIIGLVAGLSLGIFIAFVRNFLQLARTAPGRPQSDPREAGC